MKCDRAQVLGSDAPDLPESIEEDNLSCVNRGTSWINCFPCMYVFDLYKCVPECDRIIW